MVPADYSLFTETANEVCETDSVCVLFFADCRLSFLSSDDVRDFDSNPQLQNKEGKWAKKIEEAAEAARKWIDNGVKIVQPSDVRMTFAKTLTPSTSSRGSNDNNSTAPDVVLVSSGSTARNTELSPKKYRRVSRESSVLAAVRVENARLKILLTSVAGAAKGLVVLANDFNYGIMQPLEYIPVKVLHSEKRK